MKTTIRSHAAWAALAALLLAGCSGDTQMRAAVAPSPSPVLSYGATNMQRSTVPDTPTAANIVLTTEVRLACGMPERDTTFGFDSQQPESFDQRPMEALARCFSSGPMAGRRLSLVGHADPRGEAGSDMTIGQSRANAVASYLTTHGVSSTNVTSTSRGAMDATGRDEAGWDHDRRVDVALGNLGN